MKKQMQNKWLFFMVCATVVLLMQNAFADIEWSAKKQLPIDAAPLDSAISEDGTLMFMLTPGKILVYSIAQEKVVNRIPVDKSFDRLAFAPKQNRLIVTSSSKKTLKIIQLEFLQKIDITGLPYKGRKNAPVTITVFNDYQ
jgi:DNA-binding beta-propeller fold protein YncE